MSFIFLVYFYVLLPRPGPARTWDISRTSDHFNANLVRSGEIFDLYRH